MDKHSKRSQYEVAAVIRKALASPTFPPGAYTRQDVARILIENLIIHPWEIPPSLANLLNEAGWGHEDGKVRSQTWVKLTPPPQPPTPTPALPFRDEDEYCKPGTFHARVARVERMLERICASLQISTE